MSPVNILFVILQMEMGGAERLVYSVVSRLDRRLFNPSVAWLLGGKKALKEFKDLRIPLYYVPKAKRFDFSAMQKFSSIIRENDIQVVNAHHFMSLFYLFYGCKLRNQIKLVYTEHSEWEIEKLSGKWQMIGRCLFNHCDKIIGVNDKVTKLIENRFNINPLKTITVKNGVSVEDFEVNRINTELKNNIGLCRNESVIGVVANFKKIKNHIFLLQAFARLLEDFKNVKLLLIGQGFENDTDNSEQEIRQFVRENCLTNQVLFLGYRSDIRDLLGIMDIFCLVSFKEGLPISLLEAMTVGVPVIGTNTEGISDVIIHNKNGFLVEIGDVEGLKNALYTLLTDVSLRKKLSRESKLLVTSTYSLDHCINQYQGLFESIMK